MDEPDPALFAGFESREVATRRGALHAMIGGDGPPLLLLHGYPQTHLMWHSVAPLLADRYTVVATDLTGYGASWRPTPTADHEPHSKRAMARDQIEAMTCLGFDRFAVAGHDRGGRVAYRMALDHPGRVQRLAVLDIVPTGEVWRRADGELARGYWHWSFLALARTAARAAHRRRSAGVLRPARPGRTRPRPRAPAVTRLPSWTPTGAFSTIAGTVEAMCEDYRAGASVDVEHDDADTAAGAPSAVRSWCCGRRAARCPGCTATSSRSGARGPPTSAARGSMPRTSSPRTARRTPRRGCSSFLRET